ncbi:MAG TPA: hypothetical protein VMD56_03880 [Steroidobacteraceae bacterium]|nr:hypothetical protein [Steroidobacteraceae bacterium]
MRSTKQARHGSQRTPLTITLSREDLAFIESCVSLNAFDSVDQLFAAALSHYRRYVHAVNAYAEDQAHKGLTRAEILASIQCETVVTKLVEPDR